MRGIIEAELEGQRHRGQHPGLLLQRYAANALFSEQDGPKERATLLKAAIRAAQDEELACLYRQAFERWQRHLPEMARTRELQTLGRLIVGLGRENVLETGLTLHHVYGMPLIPGSSLKGVAAHYCHEVWGPEAPKFRRPTPEEDEQYREYLAGKRQDCSESYYRLLFGNTDDSGCIVFHDAWYVPGSDPQPLRLDVMTPHHSDYNRDPKDPKFRPPTDFDSPTPVPFLSVKGRFLVAVSWRGPNVPEKAEQWVECALELLCNALRYWGVGGKTSSGYGRLVPLEGAGAGRA